MPRGKKKEETPKAEVDTPETESDTSTQILDLLKGISSNMEDLDKRITRIETGGENDFQMDPNPDDVAAADVTREGIDDPRIVKIVNEVLGTDFGIELEGYEDKPGYLFTVLVPERLSEVEKRRRPVKNEKHEYITDDNGNRKMEEYFPGDRRSRAVNSTQSYDVIRDHCLKVRSNIVAVHQKNKSPIPEFKLK